MIREGTPPRTRSQAAVLPVFFDSLLLDFDGFDGFDDLSDLSVLESDLLELESSELPDDELSESPDLDRGDEP